MRCCVLFWPRPLLVAASPAFAQQPAFRHAGQSLGAETVASGLDHPWALAFLPDGRMLVTERPGRLRIVTRDGKLSDRRSTACRASSRPARAACSTSSRPQLRAEPHDLFLLRRSASAAARAPRSSRARLDDGRDARSKTFVRHLPAGRPALARPAFRLPHRADAGRQSHADDGRPLLRARRGAKSRQPYRQDRAHRARRLGAARQSVRRNRPARSRKSGPTATATRRAPRSIPRPANSGCSEHGPRGGDEINIPEAGKNYGWPVIGYGIDYSGATIHEGTHKAGMEQPVVQWTPVIARVGPGLLYRRSVSRAGRAICSSAACDCNCVVRLATRRRQGGQGRTHPRDRASACAMCAPDRTAQSGSRPTHRTGGSCGSSRRADLPHSGPRNTKNAPSAMKAKPIA